MNFIRVLYSNLEWIEKTLEEIDQLPKDNVLFILIRTDEEEGALANISFAHSKDNYALCTKRNQSADWVMLFGWDDDDFVWRKTTCVHCPGSKLIANPPLGVMHVVFRGVAVDTETWETANQIFNDEVTK